MSLRPLTLIPALALAGCAPIYATRDNTQSLICSNPKAYITDLDTALMASYHIKDDCYRENRQAALRSAYNRVDRC